MARLMPSIPSVAMSEGMPIAATSVPLIRPIRKPVRSVAPMTSGADPVGIRRPPATHDRTAVPAMERSISPVITTSVIPQAMMPIAATASRMTWILPSDRKDGVII